MAKAAVAGIAIDMSVPEPTDLAVPKWVGYAIISAAARITISVTSDNGEGEDDGGDRTAEDASNTANPAGALEGLENEKRRKG